MAGNDTRLPPVLSGRAKEVARLDTIVKRVEAGEAQYVAIEGPPGIGKTTLINHLIARTPSWRHVVVELDPLDQEDQGAALRHIFTGLMGKRPLAVPDTVEELMQLLLNVVATGEPFTLLVIEDVQWLDQLSAEVLWRAARELDVGRSIVVVSYRPNTSTFTSRIDRFLATGRRGAQFTLQPFSIPEVQEELSHRLGAPVSQRVARMVHEATNGTPFLVNTVARWLSRAPAGQRQISPALTALDSMHDGHQRIFNNALLDTIDTLSESQQYAISLLAAASRPVQWALVQRIVADAGLPAADIADLTASGLVVAREGSTEIRIAHPQLAPLIGQQLPLADRIAIHQVLALHSQGEMALYHRVRTQALAPDPQMAEELVAELVAAAESATDAGRPDSAFRLYEWAMWFSEDPGLLHAALRCAIVSDPAKLLPSIRIHLERAANSRGVSAATAFLHLTENDPQAALEALQRGLRLPESKADHMGLILLSHALSAVGRSCYTAGEYGTPVAVMKVALEQLAAARRKLSGSDEPCPVLSEVISLEAVLKLWAGLRDEPGEVGDFIREMRIVLDELADIPETEEAADTIRSVVGTLTRLQGDLATAYSMLHTAHEHRRLRPELMVDLACQLGWIAFQSGYWDEAQHLLTSAIEDALLLPEDAGVSLAQASAAVVMLARGEKEAGDALLSLATQEDHGDVVQVTVWLARALEAMMVEDYENTVRYFSLIDRERLGWAHVGHCYLALYARSLVFSGRSDLVPQLRRRVEAEAEFIPSALRDAIQETISATLSWVSQDLETTYRQLRKTVELLDTLPPVRPGAVANPGGGHALFRAFAANDISELLFNHPELSRHRGEGIRLSQEAAAVFLRCGATHMHERVSHFHTMLVRAAEFSETDADVSRPVPPDAESSALQDRAYDQLQALSSRERQIALEVAQGKSNREIATALFLSVRTVEYHVANCLSKLGLASRVELRSALRPALEIRLVPASDSARR